MKRLLLIFMVSTLFYSCSQKNGFEITGKITNAKGRKIYLDKLLTDNIEKIDSVTINEDGNFIFDGIIKEPSFYLLSLSKNEFLYLLIDTCDKISLSADAKDLHKSYMVKGSEGSELLRQIHLHLLKSLEKIDSLGLIYRKYYNTLQVDSVAKNLNVTSTKIYAEEKEFLLEFIKKNPESLTSYLALFQQLSPRDYILKPEEDLYIFRFADSCLTKKYPNSAYAKNLSSIVARTIGRIKEIEASKANLKLGAMAPDFSIQGIDGKEISLSSLRGNYVLLDFWASWCSPCRKENPNLVTCYKKYHSRGLDILQVSLDKTKSEWQAAIKKDQLNWNHVSELKFWESPIVKLYALREIPTNFLLDKEGKIIGKNLLGAELDKKLSEILK